ncbi:CopG family transcriptional regulator [Metallosphaera tengchongensis]|uniref:CopG family transcriptional regulator n=2 Tax=Metallosphaera tengchongensis TaxID=1532350 RepID=A0A6N0NZ21_9CREN|nr:CopG family transcriptional regulator [Metallosphaera tengchongensis]
MIVSVSKVVSFKVRKEIKEKMELYKDKVIWSEELRRFVEQRIAEIEAKEAVEKVMKELKEANWSFPRGTSTQLIREDRDEDS